MTFENIHQLIAAMQRIPTLEGLETFRRTHSDAITALLHQRFGETIILNSIIKYFRDNGYLLDRIIAEGMSEAARADKLQRKKNLLASKRKALRAIASF